MKQLLSQGIDLTLLSIGQIGPLFIFTPYSGKAPYFTGFAQPFAIDNITGWVLQPGVLCMVPSESSCRKAPPQNKALGGD